MGDAKMGKEPEPKKGKGKGKKSGASPPRTSAWGGRGGPLMASQVFGNRDQKTGAASASASTPSGGAASGSSSSAAGKSAASPAAGSMPASSAKPDDGSASDRTRAWDPATGKYVEEELPTDIKNLMGGAWTIPKKDD